MKSIRQAHTLPNQSKVVEPALRVQKLPWWYYALTGLIIALSIFLRFWYLDRIPTGLVADELDYVLNAKAIYHTGKSIMTTAWSPLSLTTVPGEMPKAEFPYIISLPFVGPFGLSIFTARVGYAIISVIYVLFVMATASTFFGKRVGLIAGGIAAINPWSIYYGRTAYDVPIAITGYLIAFYMLATYKGSKLLWTVVPLFIGFYSYIGTKVLFLPYVYTTLVGVWYICHKRKQTIWLTLVGLIATTMFAYFALHLQNLDTNVRMSQVFTPFDTSVAHDVDIQRRMSLASPLTNFFTNKPIVYIKAIIIKFFGAFSPTILFTNGEGIATFSLWEHGLFYPIDALFLLLGIGFLFYASPAISLLFSILISISTLPSILSTVGTTYVHRSSLMYPFLSMLIAYGIEVSIRHTKKSWQMWLVAAITCLYIVASINFAYLYFFRFPYYNSESFGLSQRIYSRYMKLANAQQIPVINISASSSVGYYRNFLFYNNIPSQKTIPPIRKAFQHNQYTWGLSSFTGECPTSREALGDTTTYILSDTSPCKEMFIKQPMIAIPTLSDGGTLYMIFNDRVCGNYALSSYPTGFTIDDFDVEHLSEEQFCTKFFIRYSNPLYLPQGKNGSWITPQ